MAVTFDLYLFTKEYIKATKKSERSKTFGGKQPEFDEVEVGAVYCRNSTRKTAIFFFDLEELIGLLDAGYAVGANKDPKEGKLGESEMPDDGSVPLTIELNNNKPLSGNFIEPDGQTHGFDSTEQLRIRILKYIAPATS
ncbi:hypothetical protein LCGC14_2453280 [marine sediment metagenome]|uniref:Uncharacterized protein n=1 Tax=marine sediment metagenome TaxID=412755 RepID=A0A0F9E9B8_9ZZZZ